ncbi:L2 [Camelus dromedarius papillomavirus 1]|uniref:Minor capsid protein L2 n=1 Tax=Camelus dromedarius papillomavirus 1 TaxID=996650 RepID=F2YGH3_9PAPI|nr:L2 [Camelus dromedarius papillomavirus 1]ADZ53054.1 L2 [Camelus dromedarius papillomavirus 1]
MAAAARRRVRRANPYDLYRTCKANNTCPPDIIPLVEGNTIADQILKWGSWAVYLGGLGIGTGVGSFGGRAPTTASVKAGIENALVRIFAGGKSGNLPRPSAVDIPLDTLGVSGGAGDTSVSVGVSEVSPVVVPEGVGPVDAAANADTLQDTVITYIDSLTDKHALIDIRPLEGGDNTQVYTSSTFSNPAFEGASQQPVLGETTNLENIFVGGRSLGDTGGESIELTEFNGPHTSTPADGRSDVQVKGRGNWFSRRYYTQVSMDPSVFESATKEYGFENPAYEGDSFTVSDEALTHFRPVLPELQDATHITASRLLRGRSGRVGVDRVASTKTIGTRSGVRIGGQVHLRHSLSSIGSDVELLPLHLINSDTPLTLETAFVEAPDASESIDAEGFPVSYSEEDLLDDDVSLPHGHLVIGSRFLNETVPMPEYTSVYKAIVPVDVSDILRPSTDPNWTNVVPEPGGDMTPGIVIDLSDDYYRHYYLHPSLLKKKKSKVRKLWYA